MTGTVQHRGAQRAQVTIPYRLILLSAAFLALVWVIYIFLPLKSHWLDIFRPATLELISLRSPYNAPHFFNPPWALIPLIPMAILPVKLGSAVLSAVTLFAFGFVAHRMGAKPLTVVLFLLLPHTLYNAQQVNVDWLVALGFILPPQIGLFFVLIKPQVGGFIALFWLVEAWREKGITGVTRTFGPVSVAFLLSFALYGNYLTRSGFLVLHPDKNFWPLSVPIGLALLVYAIRNRKAGLSITAAPLLAPYTQPYSWPIALLGLLPRQWEMIAAVAGMWIVWWWQKWPMLEIVF